VGELPLDTQTRLLRVLEQATYRPVGAADEVRADIRVVAATWRDLGARVKEGAFRDDLYHRLRIVELSIPPLRDRGDDALLLLDGFLAEASAEGHRSPPRLEPQVRAHLARWPWPGNVRELKNAAAYLAAMTRGGRVRFEDLPPSLRRAAPDLPVQHAHTGLGVRLDLPYMEARRAWLDLFQDRYVTAQLDAHEGNISAAARAAGMDRRSIQRILSRVRGRSTED